MSKRVRVNYIRLPKSCLGGIKSWCLYCTKLAPISKTNDVARSLRSREQNQKIPYLSFFGGGCGGSRLKMKGSFLVLLPPLRPTKRLIEIVLVCGNSNDAFSPSLRRPRRAPPRTRVVISIVRSHYAITSHRHARIRSRRLLGACFVFARWHRLSSW